MEIPVERKTLRMSWDLPLDRKVYEEIGKVMVEILPALEKVEVADSEGAVLELRLTEGQEEEIKKLRDRLKYINVWFEGEEDPEEIEMKRLERLFGKKRNT